MNKFIIVVAIIGVFVLGWFSFSQNSNNILANIKAAMKYRADQTDETVAPPPAPSALVFPTHPLINIDEDDVDDPLTSPFTITGEAKGPWYFEASFPVELKNSANVVIATAVAQAQADWMTTNFVPFTVTLTFPPQPAASTGTLIFKKDNPSGEPVNDDQYVVPVTF